MLFHLWTNQTYRPTRDIDFLTRGDHSVGHLEGIFRAVRTQAVEDDGLSTLLIFNPCRKLLGIVTNSRHQW